MIFTSVFSCPAVIWQLLAVIVLDPTPVPLIERDALSSPENQTAIFVQSVQQLLFNDSYYDANQICDRFIRQSENHPAGYLFKAATLLGEMGDAEENLHTRQFRDLVDRVFELCQVQLETADSQQSAVLYLWQGHAHVYRSLWESKFGSIVSAIRHGLNAKGSYHKGLEFDSTLYDLYFGLGNYHYWKTSKAGFLRTIGIVSNDIDKGIAELKLAMDSARLFSEAAANAMIWIRLDRQEYDSAISLAQQMLANYPESRTIRWPLAEASFKNDDYENALTFYAELTEHYLAEPGNFYNLIECCYYLYQCCQKLGRDERKEKILQQVSLFRSEIPSKIKKRQRSKLSYLRRELNR
ncbi:MAG: tetratricopeptide repeat protein [candidate division Zixibacteria bacterium]|nr:tetratricopeptide repeat protein [candidate division Zixibacteria bacterium]